jgi:hypothetical protein
MTQPTEAVGGDDQHVVAAELTPEDRLNAAFEDPDNHKDEEPEEGIEGDESEVAEEAEDETDIEAEDDELPPIEAPVSWDAEAKERFAKLPREDQEYLSKREGERERFVQQKAQEAAQVRKDAEQAALSQLAQIERGYAQQLHQIAAQFDVPEPDMALIATDPVTYAMQARAYQQAQAQRQQTQLQAQQLAQQAQEREAEAERLFHAEQTQALVKDFPEYLDPTTGPKLQTELSAVARELGYPPELIAQARASDILAMKTAAEWRADSLKLKALNAKKMEKVRAAKTLPKTSTPGQAKAPGAVRQAQYATDREAMRRGDTAATARVLDSFFTPTR